jgi:hypothetical protein
MKRNFRRRAAGGRSLTSGAEKWKTSRFFRPNRYVPPVEMEEERP